MELREMLEVSYRMLPPPLAALPAKYHAPISLALHSLTTGYLSWRIAELAELDEEAGLAFLLGLSHDIHQKLVYDGLSTLKMAKEYLKTRLDEAGYAEYIRYLSDALERDMCGKGNPVRGLPREIAVICHISDMAQGRLEGISLLYWLRSEVKKVSEELTVRFYSIMIPQPFARAYAMLRLYEKYIAGNVYSHIALASPWGLYVITYEDELPEVIEASWDDLRIDPPIIDYNKIKELENKVKSDNITGIQISKDEARSKLWSRFARMFYNTDKLTWELPDKKGRDEPLYPKLPGEAKGLFINIEFADIEFRDSTREAFTCGLCGMPHHQEYSLPVSMYGTKKAVKIAGVKITPEKWNRFLPAHLKVKTWDSKGPWRHSIGMCPLCTLDAIGVRMLGFAGTINGFITLSVSKPIPIELFNTLGQALRYRRSLNNTLPTPESKRPDGVVLDYATATIATSSDVPEPKTVNMFENGELASIGKLLSLGLYPLKFLPGLDTSIPDRLLTTTVTFQALNFPVTGKEYSKLIPWIVKLVEVAGRKRRSEGIEPLMDKPSHALLHLLALDKSVYDSVGSLVHNIGVRV